MFETSTHRGCIYIEQQSYELIGRKGASHDYDRRHCHVDVPRGQLRRRGGRRAHSLPDHAGADECPRGGIGQHAVEGPVPHAPRADQSAPRRLRVHRRGEGPRGLVAPIRSPAARLTPSERCEFYLVERPSCLAEGPGPVACGLDSDRGCATQRSMATSAESNRWRPSRRSSASRISGQGVSLRSPARDASATRVIFSTVGPKKRSTARSAAPRPPSLWGFSWDRAGECPGCRVWERLPADDEIRLRVVRSTSHAPSLREATQEHEPPLTGCDCPGIGRRTSRMIRPQSPPVVRQCVALVTPATTRARAEFEPYPAVAESLHRIVADRPISTGLRRGP